jgi:hypothetical protein
MCFKKTAQNSSTGNILRKERRKSSAFASESGAARQFAAGKPQGSEKLVQQG